ncbi:thiol-disulfide oxidoreductase DCC family protein [Peribacillus alkalitolerans]|uniref:thiol-disulfide oxidoreductase DCC family protein n=1 Tax=Peribacillus alkalitolerans TaxID=1550385 RepID=UPI0013D03FE3|nr:DCC1-like thiol-disulfide oxidoreductase family protein [Peribacillus alkalitolerans]
MDKIVLFDGDCGVCNRSIQFILRHEKGNVFLFAPIESSIGQQLMSKYRIPSDLNSVIFIEKGKFYSKSTAAFKICKYFKPPWNLLFLFSFIPSSIRDIFYMVVARNRYKWFRKSDSCILLTPETRKKFLN